MLFTGDSLFVGGVGAHFEGVPEDSSSNMRKLWLNCDPNTLIFPGHEYTLDCLRSRFSGQDLPSGKWALGRLTAALHRATLLRARRLPTVPACLGDEIGYNTAFDQLHNSATFLQETWRRFELVERAREDDAADFSKSGTGIGGGRGGGEVVAWSGMRSALLPAPQWLRGGHGDSSAGTLEVDYQDDGWLQKHTQQLGDLGVLVDQGPDAAVAVGRHLRRSAAELREHLSGENATTVAEEAAAARDGKCQQELVQGGGVRFVWGTSAVEKAETERLQAEKERVQAGQSCLRRCFGRYLCCCCDAPPAGEEELTPSAAARAISMAAAACGPVRGAAGVTPRRTTSDQLSSSTSLQQLESACQAMQDVKTADPEQDHDSAEDILGAFVEIGGDEKTQMIELGRLRRACETCHPIPFIAGTLR